MDNKLGHILDSKEKFCKTNSLKFTANLSDKMNTVGQIQSYCLPAIKKFTAIENHIEQINYRIAKKAKKQGYRTLKTRVYEIYLISRDQQLRTLGC